MTRGSLAAILYLVALEYGFAAAVVYILPNLGASTIDRLFVIYQAVALAGIVLIRRYLPNSKRPAF